MENDDSDSQQFRQYTSSYSQIPKIYSQQFAQQRNRDQIIKSKSFQNGKIESLALDQIIIETVQQNERDKLEELLSEADQINLHNIVDPRKYTLLHIASYNNNYDTCLRLVEHVRRQYKIKSKEIIQAWVNQLTSEGYSAFHFAAYRGNLSLLQLFDQCGANMFTLNGQGMNGIHLAAQGDQPITLVYFKKLGIDYNHKDSKGGTALHWAAYYGAENCLNYLLAFDLKMINLQDHEGYAPLHLATMTGNARIVKKLILKGADKFIKSNKGQTATQISVESGYKGIEKMLTERQGPIVEYFKITQGLAKIERSKMQLFKFISFFLIIALSTIYQLINYLQRESILVPYLILEVIFFFFFVVICTKNPGYIERQLLQHRTSTLIFSFEDKINYLYDMMKKYDAENICPDCVIVKQERSKHCDICQKCVRVYDHHCPWIDNCVGSNNLCFFYLFILSLTINILVSFSFNIWSILYYFRTDQILDDKDFIHVCFDLIVMFFPFIIMLVFFIPIIFLLSVQTKNILTGKTTFERYAKQSADKNQKLVYSIKNCYIMCCRNKKKNVPSQQLSQSLVEQSQ